MAQSPSPLLDLPSEIRLQIYEHLYSSQACSPLLILREDVEILQPLHRWFPHPGPSVVKTCTALHNEAAAILYDHARFRIQIYVGAGWPRYEPAGPVDTSNPLFRQMQHVDITVHLVDDAHIDPALNRLRLLAEAFEGSGARLKTVGVTFKAVTSYQMTVTRDLVAERRDAVLRRLEHQQSEGLEVSRLFRKMLTEGKIVSVT